MSRTVKGQKPPGFDYWTARPGNHCGGFCRTGAGNKFTKRQTHKAERVQQKAVAEGWDG